MQCNLWPSCLTLLKAAENSFQHFPTPLILLFSTCILKGTMKPFLFSNFNFGQFFSKIFSDFHGIQSYVKWWLCCCYGYILCHENDYDNYVACVVSVSVEQRTVLSAFCQSEKWGRESQNREGAGEGKPHLSPCNSLLPNRTETLVTQGKINGASQCLGSCFDTLIETSTDKEWLQWPVKIYVLENSGNCFEPPRDNESVLLR